MSDKIRLGKNYIHYTVFVPITMNASRGLVQPCFHLTSDMTFHIHITKCGPNKRDALLLWLLIKPPKLSRLSLINRTACKRESNEHTFSSLVTIPRTFALSLTGDERQTPLSTFILRFSSSSSSQLSWPKVNSSRERMELEWSM